MPAAHVFVDETKRRGLLIAAAAVAPAQLDPARRTMRSLILPRQRRLHLVKESDGRRKKILDAIVELAPAVTLYDATAHPPKRQREACLRALAADLMTARVQRLVLERDEALEELDREVLYQQVRRLDYADLRYEHLRAHQEPLLAIPDAVAWCWSRGGIWQDRVREIVHGVRIV